MGRIFKKNWKKVTGVRGVAPVRQKEIVRLTDATGLVGGGGTPDLTASGFVVGPASATDLGVVFFDGTSGKLVQSDANVYLLGGNLYIDTPQIYATAFINSEGGLRFTNKQTITANGTTITTSATVILIESTCTSCNLPASPTSGDYILIKDKDGTAGTANITISGNSKNIDGQAQLVFDSNYQSVTLYYNGTEWNIL